MNCSTRSVAFTMYNFVSAKGSLKGQYHEIYDFRIFHVSVSPKPLSILLVPFQIFLQIRWNIHSSRCTNGIAGTGGANLPPVSLIPVANCLWCHWHPCHWYQWRIATGVIDTGGKFAPVSLTLVANFQRWPQFFFKFTNPQTLGLNLQSQIRKFLRYASSPILYLRIYFHWSAKPKFANFLGPANCKSTNATLAEGSQM